MVITLIGYRGCGKTSVARLLAERMEWDWVDADVKIAEAAGKSIRAIFASEGEPGFRARERTVMHQLLDSDKLIVAAGGGAILIAATRSQMRTSGPVIWLKASPETLAARIENDDKSDSTRPSLTGKSIGEEVAEVLAERTELYEEAATITIDTESKTIEEVVDEIEHQFSQQQLTN
ncbi:MAG: shikimate kinase [Planctomyces sp.]|nr:shikimate kinase [Planctomyces sp.]